MNCPYCNQQISDNIQFCPHCGQTVSNGNGNGNNNKVNTYWNKVNQDDKKRASEYGAVMKEKAQIKNSLRAKAIIIAIVIIGVAVAGIIAFVNIQADSSKKLEQVKKELPGNTYDCSNSHMEVGFSIRWNFYKLEINNDGTLNYYYLSRIGPKNKDDKYEFKGTYSYEVSRSIFGKYEIKTNGESFTLNVDDENHPEYVSHG